MTIYVDHYDFIYFRNKQDCLENLSKGYQCAKKLIADLGQKEPRAIAHVAMYTSLIPDLKDFFEQLPYNCSQGEEYFIKCYYEKITDDEDLEFIRDIYIDGDKEEGEE